MLEGRGGNADGSQKQIGHGKYRFLYYKNIQKIKMRTMMHMNMEMRLQIWGEEHQIKSNKKMMRLKLYTKEKSSRSRKTYHLSILNHQVKHLVIKSLHKRKAEVIQMTEGNHNLNWMTSIYQMNLMLTWTMMMTMMIN